MRLAERVPTLAPLGGLQVHGLCSDSRLAAAGDCFFAVPGEQNDGLGYAAEAVLRGAVAVVSEKPAPVAVPNVVVGNVRQVLAQAARAFFGLDASYPKYAGVTGTNGKTTTTYVFEAIGRAAGAKVGLLGTIEQRLGDKSWPATHTTLEALPLAQRLVEMRRAGADWAVMEVSSHGLALQRVDALRFSLAAFSNLTPDHLDFHGTMREYGDAKARLFGDLMTSDGCAVINVDGAGAERMLAAVPAGARTLRVGRTDGADVRLVGAESTRVGLALQVESPLGRLELSSELIGDFNIDNLLLGVGMAVGAGFSREQIVRGVERLRRVPGRLSKVVAKDGRLAFVDYAHTPDALVRVLATVRPLCKGRLICVFGCGGDRDRSKRRVMGEAVAHGADVAIVTSDNPRTESPEAIIAEVVPGLNALPTWQVGASKGWLSIVDRSAAIAEAARLQRPDDVVIVAGKGHETYQILGAEKRHFDDLEQLEAAYLEPRQ